MQYLYIHGFNSGPQSRSGTSLELLLGKPVLRAHNDYSLPYLECLARLNQFIYDNCPQDDSLCVMGTSLGGFYALQLRLPQIERVVAWNPVTFPALQLADFVGENVRFTDGQKWNFSREALLSYGKAADPREWLNFYWQACYAESVQAAVCPQRQIIIGNHDELLDHELSELYWEGHAAVQVIDSGHSIEDFRHAREFLID